jgi:hypothetical protein
MSWRGDWDDERPRSWRRPSWRDDDPDAGLFRPETSGAVTAVAVMSFVLGSLMLCMGMCMFLFAAFLRDVLMRSPILPQSMIDQVGLLILITVVLMTWSAGTIVSGIGVVLRQQWGRILCLVMSGIGICLAILWFVVGIQARDPIGNLHIMNLVVCMIQAVVILVHALLALVVLLNTNLTWEFRTHQYGDD